jgi:hypothetical protein
MKINLKPTFITLTDKKAKMLGCLPLASLSSLVLCNSPAYWAHSQVVKKMKHYLQFLTRQWTIFALLHYLYNTRVGPISWRYVTLDWRSLPVYKYSSLLGPFVSYEDKLQRNTLYEGA